MPLPQRLSHAPSEGPLAEDAHFFDRPANVRRLLRLLFGACALLVAVDLLDVTGLWEFRHPHLRAEGWPGFYPFYGFVGCVLLVLAARVLRLVVMRSEDYYEPVDEDPKP